jgi:segregation and condensation protein A
VIAARRWEDRGPARRSREGVDPGSVPTARSQAMLRTSRSSAGLGMVGDVTLAVRDLELDLDAFEGPFDLLLTLVIKDQLAPADVDIAAIVVAFVERLAERDELDLEACGEFLVLIAALLELKARHLFPEEEAELAELEPEEAAEELARRLAEYRRMKEAAAWLSERLASEGGRFFRLGPAPLAPAFERKLADQDPARLGAALRTLAVEPPRVSLSHMALRFPPVGQFLERFRGVLLRRRVFDFDTEVDGLSRVEQAVAFLALLELCKGGEIVLSQAQPFAPIRVTRSGSDRVDHELRDDHERTVPQWTEARSA